MNPDEEFPPEPVPPHTPERPSDAPPVTEGDRTPPAPVKLPGHPHAPERVAGTR